MLGPLYYSYLLFAFALLYSLFLLYCLITVNVSYLLMLNAHDARCVNLYSSGQGRQKCSCCKEVTLTGHRAAGHDTRVVLLICLWKNVLCAS